MVEVLTEFFFIGTAATEIETLSLRDALPILTALIVGAVFGGPAALLSVIALGVLEVCLSFDNAVVNVKVLKNMSPLWRKLSDRKSTRLNSSHANISYAVFCLKKTYYIIHACH